MRKHGSICYHCYHEFRALPTTTVVVVAHCIPTTTFVVVDNDLSNLSAVNRPRARNPRDTCAVTRMCYHCLCTAAIEKVLCSLRALTIVAESLSSILPKWCPRMIRRASDFPFQKKQFSVSKKVKFRFDSVSLLATLNSMKSQYIERKCGERTVKMAQLVRWTDENNTISAVNGRKRALLTREWTICLNFTDSVSSRQFCEFRDFPAIAENHWP